MAVGFTVNESAPESRRQDLMTAGNKELVENRSHKASRPDTLALLYQNVFTGIVRLQSGRQRLSDSGTFRRRITDALQDIQKDAAAAGYRSREIHDAECAVVAFLDEAVLSLKDRARDTWAKQTLSMELYNESNAGEVFYERLDDLSGEGDSNRLADVLEVYLLCLLLGFEGRFSGSMRAEAARISDRLRRRVEAIRGSEYRLAPPLRFPANDGELKTAERPRDARRWWLGGLVAFPFLLWLLFKIYLSVRVSGLVQLLQSWR